MNVDFEAIGQRIAKRRKVLNLTQEEVADKAGITVTHVRNIERAHTKCSIETMCRICAALDVNPDYLFLGVLKPADDDQLATIVASLKLCNEWQLKLIASLIDCVVEEGVPINTKDKDKKINDHTAFYSANSG